MIAMPPGVNPAEIVLLEQVCLVPKASEIKVMLGVPAVRRSIAIVFFIWIGSALVVVFISTVKMIPVNSGCYLPRHKA